MLVKEKKIPSCKDYFDDDNLSFEEFSELKEIDSNSEEYSWNDIKKLLSLKRSLNEK